LNKIKNYEVKQMIMKSIVYQDGEKLDERVDEIMVIGK